MNTLCQFVPNTFETPIGVRIIVQQTEDYPIAFEVLLRR